MKSTNNNKKPPRKKTTDINFLSLDNLMELPINALSDKHLVQIIREVHKSYVVPRCKVCRSKLEVINMGYGVWTRYACAKRGISSEHFRQSEWLPPNMPDPWVIELCDRFVTR